MSALLVNAGLTTAAYLIGSISGSLAMGRWRGVDIRTMGSGNAGGTNAFRTQGLGFALPVVLIDIGKGCLAAYLPILVGKGAESALGAQVLCAAAAVIGHCYPLWHGFRGGKGAGTALGTFIVIAPTVILPAVVIWLLTLIATGWVGLATIVAFIALAPLLLWQQQPMPVITYGLFLGVLILFTHRSNIRRMLDGTENRFEKIWWRNWFRGP